MFGGPDPRLCAEAPDPGQRSEVGAGPMSLTDLTPFAGHIVSWGGSTRIYQALKKPTPPALCMTVQVSAELGGARHRR